MMTFNEHETAAVVNHFHPHRMPKTKSIAGITYRLLGTHGGMSIVLRISKQGEGEAQNATHDAIKDWAPMAVIGVGIAFGVNAKKQKIGDVLISTSIRDYELGRIGPEGTLTPRGPCPPSSDILSHRILDLDHIIKSQPNACSEWPTLHFGAILSGNKLVDNLDYRNSLIQLEKEAIGGEMEAMGIFFASHRHNVDWIIVKAICDWGDGNKNNSSKENDQQLAADNAALVVKRAINMGNLFPEHARKGEAPTSMPHEKNDGEDQPPSADFFMLKDHDAIPEHCMITDIKGCRASLKKEIVPKQRTAESGEGIDVLSFLTRWVNETEGPPLFCLLGEYGMGKTVTAQRMTRLLAENH